MPLWRCWDTWPYRPTSLELEFCSRFRANIVHRRARLPGLQYTASLLQAEDHRLVDCALLWHHFLSASRQSAGDVIRDCMSKRELIRLQESELGRQMSKCRTVRSMHARRTPDRDDASDSVVPEADPERSRYQKGQDSAKSDIHSWYRVRRHILQLCRPDIHSPMVHERRILHFRNYIWHPRSCLHSHHLRDASHAGQVDWWRSQKLD